MYLTRGQPVTYYGDEQGFVGSIAGSKDRYDQSYRIDRNDKIEYVAGSAEQSIDVHVSRITMPFNTNRAFSDLSNPVVREPGAILTPVCMMNR